MDLNPNSERRQDVRSAQSGAVDISFEDPAQVVVHAELIEASARGFRAAHNAKALAPGLEVDYTTTGGSGRARVMWTHVLEGRCVSGFLVLPS